LIAFRSAARSDLAKIVIRYRAEYEGRSERFVLALDGVLSTIADSPLGYPLFSPEFQDVRIATIPRFPFRVVYLAGIKLQVLAIWHVKQDPKRLSRRVG
jgi:plasmid stabilization system protein ParE